MRRQRLRAVVVPLAVLALVAAACGGGDDAATDDGPAEDTVVDDAADDPADDTDDDAGDEPAAAGGPQVGGTLVAAVPEDLDATDPHRTSGETGPVWLSLMFETLVFVDQDRKSVV